MQSLQYKLLKNFNDKTTADVLVRIMPLENLLVENNRIVDEFYCHRLLLCQEKYWETMFLSPYNYSEQRTRTVSLKLFDASWMNKKCFETFLQCFYVDRQFFVMLKIDPYVRELHYLAVYINFKPLIEYCETLMINSLTLQNSCDMLRYTTFVFPDYTNYDNNTATRNIENLPNQKEEHVLSQSPWNYSTLYKSLLQWINVFYPVENKENFLKSTIDELLQDNASLLKQLFQNNSALFKTKQDRLNHLRRVIAMHCTKHPSIIDIYRNVDNQFAKEHENQHRSCIYFFLTPDNKPKSDSYKMTKDFQFKNFTWRITYKMKDNMNDSYFVSIAVFDKEKQKMAPTFSLSHSNIVPKRKMIRFHTKITFINLHRTQCIGGDSAIPIGLRADFPDEHGLFLADPFMIDAQRNKVAVACIEITFLGFGHA